MLQLLTHTVNALQCVTSVLINAKLSYSEINENILTQRLYVMPLGIYWSNRNCSSMQ